MNNQKLRLISFVKYRRTKISKFLVRFQTSKIADMYDSVNHISQHTGSWHT